jgi:hypothetical protein
MAKKQINAYFIQETWIEGGDFDTEVNGYHVFCHNRPLGSNLHHGVAMVLSPRYYAGWKTAGGKDPIVLGQEDKFVGRIIRLTIKLECRNSRGRKIRGGKQKRNSLLVSLVSAYHPCHSNDEYSRFLDKMDSVLQKLPRSKIVIGADINANVGDHDRHEIQGFNQNALALTSANMDYDDFNTAILDAGKAPIVTIKERYQGWYEFSKNDLMPIIEEKNRLVHTLRHTDGIPDAAIISLKCHLKRVTKHVKDMVLLAKSRWYSNIIGQ